MNFIDRLKPKYYNSPSNNNEEQNLNNLVVKLQEKFPNFSFEICSAVSKFSSKTTFYIKCKSDTQDSLPFTIPVPFLENTPIFSNPEFSNIQKEHANYKKGSDYFYLLVEEAIKQHTYLHENFPEVFFKTKMRIKSDNSVIKKLNDIMEYNKIHPDYPKSLQLHDFFGLKHVISSAGNTNDEEVLESYCNKFKHALDAYYENEQQAPLEIYENKNYIRAPKANGYKSIHLKLKGKNDTNCKCEVQIRTLDMEINSRSGPWSHSTYKPRFFNQYSLGEIPTYMEISPDKNRYDEYEYFVMPEDIAFKHYYGVSISTFKQNQQIYKPIIKEIEALITQNKDFQKI